MKYTSSGVRTELRAGIGMENSDLSKMLMEIINKYGKNEGYVLLTISWSKNNMLSRYGEFQ